MTTISARLIASTKIDRAALAEIGYREHAHELPDGRFDLFETDIDELHEAAGRNCYLSWSRPNPNTATNAGYLDHIHEVGHESIEEHGSATFYIHASRSVLAELERHRHLSFSVVSQRYVDASNLGYHVPPALSIGDGGAILERAWEQSKEAYRLLVDELTDEGWPRKQAREAARAVMPNMTDSPMVVTGNLRAWKHVIRMRWHVAADAEIRELAGLILAELRKIAPNTMQDVPDVPFGS
ncbi:FAD-dependent thymidylate synthase [Rhodococcus ruber]|uniref:FAD-dependent thymidylate synthase n=1 Tax=Rhodococcus ruber TaxID=1830 RepID=A0A098BL88_9NOCA|nr:FAD-dependent thymidylate synthase [Rhodococcus ruber]MCZ4533340.1 FAD-dependent thymidylate synthase [Rhodococcus ruber]MCZ4533409.1 FAD-dependent thymidylate synthase [Rhodococcus ruber]CDZ89005.1 putative thymidylate synthase [Rhodococcus ruber]